MEDVTAMGFKKIRSINCSYARQGQIYFTLLNYREQPCSVQKRIDSLISTACGGDEAYCAALRGWLLRGESWDHVLQKYYVDRTGLLRARKWLYEHW